MAPITTGVNQSGIFATTCFRHLPNLDALRQQLQSVPQLPPEKAVHFLVGRQGQAWPVPDRHGTYVLIL
ncbi:NMCC_0638 family (lipo)protein [Halopseudomonas sp. Lyrl_26]|uniref:NMCC_0638 family (lipo)protein n=1 Tax=Halopseudomonas sp. Lyrl_26 TaxID=3110923 RepID=UPI003F7D6435